MPLFRCAHWGDPEANRQRSSKTRSKPGELDLELSKAYKGPTSLELQGPVTVGLPLSTAEQERADFVSDNTT